MVAITRRVGETLRVGNDVYFQFLKVEGDEIQLEVLASSPVYLPFRTPPKVTYLGEPEVIEIPENL